MKSPAFQMYPADFLADQNTIVMSVSEIGAYCLLLFVCWNENGLPNDMNELARSARMPLKQFQLTWEKRIRRCFLMREDGKWTHKRLEKERDKQIVNRAKRQAAGEKGAERRWQTHSNAMANPPPRGSNAINVPMAKNGLSVFSLQSSITPSGVVDANATNGDNRNYPFDHFAVIEYEQTLKPEPGLAIQQAEVIAVAVQDSALSREVWTNVLREWKGNGYHVRHAGKAVDKYANEMAAIAEGKRQPPPGPPPTPVDKQRQQEELARKMGREL